MYSDFLRLSKTVKLFILVIDFDSSNDITNHKPTGPAPMTIIFLLYSMFIRGVVIGVFVLRGGVGGLDRFGGR